jgi:uncharacterized protein with NRDE domain
MVVHKRVKGYPLVLAANRDEYFDRPTRGPRLLAQTPAIWGGQDARAGGTWLGVNAYGVVVGLTNRRTSAEQTIDTTRRSRGLLCLEALQCRTAAEVVAWLSSELPARYNPFNILIVDQHAAFWTVCEQHLATKRLEPGVHILANGNINDFETVRIRRARHLLQRTEDAALQTLLPLLERVCRDHEIGVQDRETICMHRPQEHYGTVSSTILALTPDLQGSVYRYADGHPCLTPYKEYRLPFAVRP